MRAFLITLFLLLGVTSGVIAQAAPAKAPELKVIAAPDQIASHPSVIGAETELALKDIYGVEQKLSDLRGRVVVLNFWATYCSPCVREMPELIAIQNQYAALVVQVVGASLDTSAEQNEVRKFITNLKINFPIWLGATTKDMARFGFGATIPNTAIIGRDGKVVTVFRGAIDRAILKKQLDSLIARSHTRGRRREWNSLPELRSSRWLSCGPVLTGPRENGRKPLIDWCDFPIYPDLVI